MLKARAFNAMKLFTRGVASNFHLKFEDFLCLLKKVHYSDTFAAISAGIFASHPRCAIKLKKYSWIWFTSKFQPGFFSVNHFFALKVFFLFSANDKCSPLIPKLNKMRQEFTSLEIK